MIRYTRGARIPISATFYDSSGDIAYPSSVHLTIAYPGDSTSSGVWPLSGDELLTTSGISMTTPTTATTAALVGVWQSTWGSAASGTGTVYWTAVPSTDGLAYGIKEGRFELRGGLANPTAVATTLA